VLRQLGLSGARTLRDKTRVHVHHGSADLAATVDLPEGPPTRERPVVARLRFDHPVFALAGERFVVRDWSAAHTLAGGIVVEIDPPRPGWRERGATWHARAAAADDALAWARSDIAWLRAVPPSALLQASVFSATDITAAADRLVAGGEARRVGDPSLLVDASWWTALRATALGAIDAHHAAHPEQRGMPLPAFRTALGKAVAGDALDALLADLAGEGVVRAGDAVKRAAHLPALPAGLQRAGAAVRSALSRRPLDPPARKALAPDGPTRAALAFLLETGEAVEVSPELVLSAEAVHHAAQRIRAHLRPHGRATVSELKQLLESNRRVMVPLMEFFDRTGVTRRVGDYRVLPEAGNVPRPT
jgi:selenocysteine-specific elongation factor